MSNIFPMQTGTSTKGKKTVVKKKMNPIRGRKAIDHLDVKFLSRYINDQGKILPRRITGVTATQQKAIARAIKYARHLALIPFVASDLN